jgi:exonuclease III
MNNNFQQAPAGGVGQPGLGHQFDGLNTSEVAETAAVLRRTRGSVLGPKKALNLGVWNVCSMAKTARGEVLVDDLEKHGIDIACLTESHMPASGGPVRFIGSSGQRTMYFTSHSEQGVGGVAMALTDEAERALTAEPTMISNRLMSACFQQKIGLLTIIVCYAPTNPSSDADKDAFYGQLDAMINAVPRYGATSWW